MATIFNIHKLAASPFNSKAVALAGTKLIDGEPIGCIILNSDNVLPPPAMQNDLADVLIGLNLLWCSWLLKIGIKKNISYPVHKATLKKFEVYWRSNVGQVDDMGEDHAIVAGQFVPDWIKVFNRKLYFFGVVPSVQNIAAHIQALSSTDFVYKGAIYREEKNQSSRTLIPLPDGIN